MWNSTGIFLKIRAAVAQQTIPISLRSGAFNIEKILRTFLIYLSFPVTGYWPPDILVTL